MHSIHGRCSMRSLTGLLEFIKKRCPESGSGEVELTPEVINNVSTPSPSTPDATVEQPEVEVLAPVQAESIPDVLSPLIAELKPVAEQLKALVTGKTKDEVNVEEVTYSLQSIETLLKGGLNVKIPLTLGDKRITIFDLAKLVATLLDEATLFGVLTLVIRVIGSLKIPIVSDLIAIVGELVVDLLTTVFGIIPGLKPVLGPLLEVVIGLLKIFHFASISKTIEI
ncbi:hypothetical protein BKA70DRAFT_1565899 [Coprinopsis sp. MPI-PUGE-AT-0042]|nr:hypothetical protein BKA70DRAFT_1565899 [Coprinopsis sp. MPI-PUGE-AT-0042]